MDSKAEGQSAIDGLNGKELKGRALKVNEARPRTESRGGRGGYGGGKGGYGGGKEDKVGTVVSNHRHLTYITMII